MIDTKPKLVSRTQEIIFTNWSDEELNATYDLGTNGGVDVKSYKLAARKSYYIPFFIAEEFARILANREYQKVWNENFKKVRAEAGLLVDRRTQEHQATSLTNLNRQELIDRCVEIIPVKPEDISMIFPQEVKLREVILNRDERNDKFEKETGIPSQVNRKAIRQKEKDEEFE